MLRADGTPLAMVGEIASMSAIAITLVAPLLGFFLVRRQLSNRVAYPLATLVCLLSVVVGFAYPVGLPSLTIAGVPLDPVRLWILLIVGYVCIAAALPVWTILLAHPDDPRPQQALLRIHALAGHRIAPLRA